ncbi:hypothetical protein [Candidatus Pelagibacter sp. HIMB1542]|uniref:hypothetical protein n=1 Tax=Candidatus Pelagibacter sp. HIMB1542 TaxID=3413346 RepID=UPI003F8304BF
MIASLGIFFSFICIYLIEIIKNQISLDLFLFLIITISSFFLGLIDDKYKLTYKKKFLILIPLLLITIFFSENFIISKYKFQIFETTFSIDNVYFSTFITSFFLLLLMNSINLIDGINGLAIGIITIWIIYYNFFILDHYSIYFISLIISALITFYFIYKGFYFLGDSGSLFLSSMIGLLIIQEYNLKIHYPNKIFVENIFILFMLPGYDMFRVFLVRIYRNKNPFLRSRDHLHDYLIKKFGLFSTLSIFFIYIVFFLFLYHLQITNNFLLIVFSLILYLGILYIALKKIQN